jgi:hypothetical protein
MMARLGSQLGPLKGTFTSHLTNINAQNNNGVSETTADWTADATFEKGSGVATMQLISRNGKWQILKMNVESAALKTTPDATKPDEPNLTTTGATTG